MTGLERNKIIEEAKELGKKINEYLNLLQKKELLVEQIKKELSALERQLRVMEYGSQSEVVNGGNIFHSFSEIPELNRNAMEKHDPVESPGLDAIYALTDWTNLFIGNKI